MRRFRWAILIGQLILLTLALVVPRVDLPQTAFDEGDTPVNQATVTVVLGCRAALQELQTASSTTASLLRTLLPAWPSAQPLDLHRRDYPASRSLVKLLCTLLC